MKITPRGLWFLIALLAASNLATGLGIFYLLGRVDRAHSEIFDPALSGLSELRELAWQSTNMQRAVLNLLLATNPVEREAVKQRFAKSFQSNRRSLDRLRQTDFEGVDDALEQTLGQAGERYLECASKVGSLVDAGREAEAQLLRTTELRRCFEAYQSAQVRVATSVSDHAATTSSNLTRSVTGIRSLLLAAASLPLLVLAALGLSFVVFVLLLYRIISRLQSDR